MLGEAATPKPMPTRYRDYVEAIHAIGKDAAGQGVYEAQRHFRQTLRHPSALLAPQHRRVMGELLPRLKELFLWAKNTISVSTSMPKKPTALELSLI